MKCYNLLTILFLLVSTYTSSAQISDKWKSGEINKANTVVNCSYLNEIEKEAIITLNLARLFPKKFMRVELKPFGSKEKKGTFSKKSPNKSSLISDMKKMEATAALVVDSILTENAKCLANESGENGSRGHNKIQCEKIYSAECCSYGMNTGKEIIMQLLIDFHTKSLGHRKICLDNKYASIGIGTTEHKKYGSCCVIQFLSN